MEELEVRLNNKQIRQIAEKTAKIVIQHISSGISQSRGWWCQGGRENPRYLHGSYAEDQG